MEATLSTSELLHLLRQPIKEELQRFAPYFREQMRSKVFFLDLILRYLLRQKGKQIRPLLVFLSARAAGAITERTYVGATMVELLHTATLVHDDVVDQAEVRRGMASVRAVWKNKVAVLVGDFLLARGLLIAIESHAYDLLEVTSHAVKRMSEGELRQMQRAKLMELDEDSYFAVIRDKTASLIATCCEIGARSAGASPDTCEHLRQYGEAVGMAFQIRDDLLDFLGKPNILGKPIGNDLQEGKITLPLLYALNAAPRKESKRVLRLVKHHQRSNGKALQEILAFVHRYGGIEYANQVAEQFIQRAKEHLTHLPLSNAREALELFADFVLQRGA